MTSSLGGSQSHASARASHQSSSSRTSYNFGVRSYSDTISRDSEKKMPAETVPSKTEEKQKSISTNSKKVSSQSKAPKKDLIKDLGSNQEKLIQLMNVLLLNDVNELRDNNCASEEEIMDRKEIISTQYAQNFHPTENNQRSFMNSLQAVQKNIQKINKQISQKKSTHNTDGFTMVSDNATNLTQQEAMKSFAFKKNDFNNTRIQF